MVFQCGVLIGVNYSAKSEVVAKNYYVHLKHMSVKGY